MTVSADQDVRQAARKMIDAHVGTLVVEAQGRAVGIVTDRDLALGVLRRGLDPATTAVSTCMSSPLVSVPAEARIDEVARTMGESRIRRVARVDAKGRVVAIVALDDVVAELGRRWSSLARLIERERRQEPGTRTSPPPIYGKE